MNIFAPSNIEKIYWKKNLLVIGVDEVGRGALAGPLYVGAVCFQPIRDRREQQKINALGIYDSKKVTKIKREYLVPEIKKISIANSIVSKSVAFINTYGIQNATIKAFQEAVFNIVKQIRNAHFIVVLDGYNICTFSHKQIVGQRAIIHGDSRSLSIAGASIIAKVARDSYMYLLHNKASKYKWITNVGYGTSDHLHALCKYGKTKYHRDRYVRNYV